MFFISHRGNVNGKNQEYENNPEYILEAISLGFDVEVDIWLYKTKLYLGHDEPQFEYKNDLEKYNTKLWHHAKNIDAINILYKKNFHFFWHEDDDMTITSKGFWWTYPGKKLFKNSICVLPEMHNQKSDICAGYCSDLIEKYR